MAFARENTKLQPNQEAFLTALMGHLTIEFADGKVDEHFPDLKVPVKGELKPFAGFEEKGVYDVLFCNERMAVIRSTLENGEDDVGTYYFVGPDEMWIYTGSNKPAVPDLHTREYFRRVP